MKTLFMVFILSTLIMVACSSEPEQITVVETREVPVTVEVIKEVDVTREVVTEVELTRIVEIEVTRVVEKVIEVEVTQTLTAQPVQFISLDGSGNIVSDNYDLQPCQKAVFSWVAEGKDNMIVFLWKVGVDENRLLINEIGPGSGEALQSLSGGTYWLTVEGPSDGWTVTAECRD